MTEILSTELKSDLEDIYKKAGDLLTYLDVKSGDIKSKDTQELVDMVRLRLRDITGTLQKDIFNCDYLITKYKTVYTDEFQNLKKE